MVPSRFEWSPALNLTPSNATDAPAASLAPDAPATPPLLDHERLDCFSSRARIRRDGPRADEVRPSIPSRSDRARILFNRADPRGGLRA